MISGLTWCLSLYLSVLLIQFVQLSFLIRKLAHLTNRQGSSGDFLFSNLKNFGFGLF